MKATAKDIRYNLKSIMEMVERGEEVFITNRGRIRALIVAADSVEQSSGENPFCGMWKDREDLADVYEHVRSLRKGRY